MKFITRSLLVTALIAPSLAAPMAWAGQSTPTQVIELFTSQGCSSCPPSNALLTDFTEDPSVLGLSYSVEYWDYLGWKDTFADKEFSDRQRAYSAAIGHGRVYTPQMVINGAFDKPRFKKSDLRGADLKTPAPKIAAFAGGRIKIGASDTSKATVRLVTYRPGTQDVSVKRGENGGRTLTLTNVVTDVKMLGNYTGKAISLDGKLSDPDSAYAVIVQDGEYGPILAAASYTP